MGSNEVGRNLHVGNASMNQIRTILMTSLAALALAGILASAAHGGEIRGFPGGQAAYYNGYYGAAPSHAYAPPQTAYFAPAYQRGYPVQQAYYPQGVAVAPSAQAARIAYYAPPPTVAYYAPASPGYAISPAGGATSGAEAFAHYGQQQRLNYVPPTHYYQTRMVAVPVTYYRPVVVYQPGTTVPTTSQKACAGTQCQPQRWRLFSCFGNSCNSGSTTCNYGSAPAAACGTVPYYNTVPGVAAPATVYPTVPGSRGFNNILTPRTTIPPPGTGIIGPGATTTPSISPGTPIPGGIPLRSTTPGVSPSPPRPSTFPIPSGSSGSNFGSGSGATIPAEPGMFGSSFRSNFKKDATIKPQNELQLSRPTISEPGMKPRITETPSTLRPVPDPEAGQRVKPGSRAPALLNPNDKTARARTIQPLGAATWDVVPARWPERTQEVKYQVQTASAQQASAERQFSDTTSPAVGAPTSDEKWDDSGWKSAR
jgi:hypothetical protein